MTWNPYTDAAARATFMRFEQALRPLMAEVAPDWLLHHIELVRDLDPKDYTERVRIALVCKPIGSATEFDPDADLRTGPRRIRP